MKRVAAWALALLLMLSCAALAEAGENPGGVLTATGSASVMVEADTATITLGVTEYASDVKEAQNTVNQKIATIRAALIVAGVDNADITTDSIYIYANYDYVGDGDVQRVVGYNASNSLSVCTKEMDKVGTLIDVAFAAGANELNNVRFSCTNSSEARDQALTLATQQAMAKAKVIAEAAGVKLGSIQSITEGSDYYYDDSGFDVAVRAEASAKGGTDIQASMINVYSKVTVIYAIQQ